MGSLALGLGIAACGGSGSHTATRPVSSAQGDRSFLAFTRCMREHGVHMSDPYHRAGHSGLTLDLPSKTPPTIRAYSQCNHLIASDIAMKEAGMAARQSQLSPQQATARHLELLHYARCMRARGIPMLDPDANGNPRPRQRAGNRRGWPLHAAVPARRPLMPVAAAGGPRRQRHRAVRNGAAAGVDRARSRMWYARPGWLVS